MEDENTKFKKRIKFWQILTLVFLVLAVVGIFRGSFSITGGTTISEDKAKEVASDFITKNLVGPGTTVTIEDVTKAGNVYALDLVVSLNGQTQKATSYLSTDGAMFFAAGINIEEFEKLKAEAGAATESEPVEIPKTSKPVFKLFVMSQCPYGVQVENLMGSVIDLIGNKMDFKLYFIANDNGDGTFSSLHGQPEVDEDLRQVCAAKYYPEKYFDYVLCVNKDYRNAGTIWENCAKSSGLDSAKIKTCAEGDEGKKLLSENIKEADKLKVSGSPTVYINEVSYSGQRTSEALKDAICSAFETEPSECSKELTTTATSSTAAGNCG